MLAGCLESLFLFSLCLFCIFVASLGIPSFSFLLRSFLFSASPSLPPLSPPTYLYISQLPLDLHSLWSAAAATVLAAPPSLSFQLSPTSPLLSFSQLFFRFPLAFSLAISLFFPFFFCCGWGGIASERWGFWIGTLSSCLSHQVPASLSPPCRDVCFDAYACLLCICICCSII